MGLGTRIAKAVLDSLFSGGGTLYMGLHPASPGNDGQAGNEISGGSYARPAIDAADWDAATGTDPVSAVNNADVDFAQASADWASGNPLTHFSLWDHPTNTAEANFVGWGVIQGGTGRIVLNGDTLHFYAGDLAMVIDLE